MKHDNKIVPFQPAATHLTLRRPAALVRAARAGQSGWQRARDLPKLLRLDSCPRPARALALLHVEEEVANRQRLAHDPLYDMHRHILLVIAIVAEMREAVDQPKAVAG